MDPIRIKIIVGSTREGRFSEKPARWIFEEAQKRSGVEAELLDLRDYPMPFYDAPVSPSQAGGRYGHETVRRWSEKIGQGDAFIIVTPEYNHGPSAVLKNAIDWLWAEWHKKPVGFVGYGSALGARAIEQLRLSAIELQMAPIRNAIHIPYAMYQEANKTADGASFISLEEVKDRFLDQLLWWAAALVKAHQAD